MTKGIIFVLTSDIRTGVPTGSSRRSVRVAVVGSGIAGLAAARRLEQAGFDVTLFEAEQRLGGHTHTVDVELDGFSAPVDTGFLVYNDRTYPQLIRLFDELGIESTASDMSFSLRNDADQVEWSGTDLGALFAQPINLLRLSFWRMLVSIVRFNRAALACAAPGAPVNTETLGEHLERCNYGREFRDWYLLPMAAAIWSSPQSRIPDFPLVSFARFCANHGLLQITGRPQWRTVQGGGREYVRRIAASLADVRAGTPVTQIVRRAAGVDVTFVEPGQHAQRTERFDHIVLACHSDQALALLGLPTRAEAALLGAIRYQRNRVLLHTDAALMPRRRRAWSAWNYLAVPDAEQSTPVAVTYWLNRLQPMPFRTPVLLTLNPPIEPDARTVLREFEYWHPLQDAASEAARVQIAAIQGLNRTYFCGAWMGSGFHEDGLVSGHAAADALIANEARLMSVPTKSVAAHDSLTSATAELAA